MTADSLGDDLRGRVRGLLVSLADQLPTFTVNLVDELIDANEHGIAVEILSDMLVESEASLSGEIVSIFETVVADMHLDPGNVDRLRPLVVATEDPT